MPLADLVGTIACLLVLATFSCRGMLGLRAVAILSNVAFVAYGLMLGLWPIVILHAVLFPINLAHLLRRRADRGGMGLSRRTRRVRAIARTDTGSKAFVMSGKPRPCPMSLDRGAAPPAKRFRQ